jgi:hypothetical protein
MAAKLCVILLISLAIFSAMTFLAALRVSSDNYSNKYLRNKKKKSKSCIKEDKL